MRTLATDKGYEWGMYYNPDGSGKEEGFKGKFFLEQPTTTSIPEYPHYFIEKKVTENGIDIRGYDPEINFVEDNTIIDGEFQDDKYWRHRLDDINEWLKVEPLSVPEDTCVIGFRGGEYYMVPELGLMSDYYDAAIAEMRKINPDMQFHVVTDDVGLAKEFFPNFPITHDIAMDWKKIRFAKYSIIANSSFYIMPRILKHHTAGAVTIAPRYWARRKNKVWALPCNYYPEFRYV